MSSVQRTDGWDGNNAVGVVQYVQLWCVGTTAIAVGDWVAVYATDTTNPGAIDGESFRLADSDNIGAATDTVGVATQALALNASGFILVQVSGSYVGANVDSGASVANGDPLCIGSTGGRAIEQVLDASTTANRRTIGICRSTPSANTATVEILPHPRFLS